MTHPLGVVQLQQTYKAG